MNMLLKQARKGMKALVDEDRQTISIDIPVDPSDPWSTPVTKTFSGRISHESSSVPDLGSSTIGLSTNLNRFLSVEYDVDFLVAGALITDKNGKQWKLGSIDPLEKFGGIHGYECPLEEAV